MAAQAADGRGMPSTCINSGIVTSRTGPKDADPTRIAVEGALQGLASIGTALESLAAMLTWVHKKA